VSPRETASFPGRGESWRAIARGRGLLLFGLGGGSKLGGPHRSRLQLMTQFQAQVPHPLRDDLPRVLTARSVRTPAVGVLFLLFIGKDRGVSPAMQVEGDDIGSSESALRQIGEEEFVD